MALKAGTALEVFSGGEKHRAIIASEACLGEFMAYNILPTHFDLRRADGIEGLFEDVVQDAAALSLQRPGSQGDGLHFLLGGMLQRASEQRGGPGVAVMGESGQLVHRVPGSLACCCASRRISSTTWRDASGVRRGPPAVDGSSLATPLH